MGRRGGKKNCGGGEKVTDSKQKNGEVKGGKRLQGGI